MDFSKWITKAVNVINEKINENQKFELKSLFEGCEWERLTRGEKISFGKYFANEVREGRINNVVARARGRDNHSIYEKIVYEKIV